MALEVTAIDLFCSVLLIVAAIVRLWLARSTDGKSPPVDPPPITTWELFRVMKLSDLLDAHASAAATAASLKAEAEKAKTAADAAQADVDGKQATIAATLQKSGEVIRVRADGTVVRYVAGNAGTFIETVIPTAESVEVDLAPTP